MKFSLVDSFVVQFGLKRTLKICQNTHGRFNVNQRMKCMIKRIISSNQDSFFHQMLSLSSQYNSG